MGGGGYIIASIGIHIPVHFDSVALVFVVITELVNESTRRTYFSPAHDYGVHSMKRVGGRCNKNNGVTIISIAVSRYCENNISKHFWDKKVRICSLRVVVQL